MTTYNQRIFDRLEKVALESSSRFKLAACIVENGIPLQIGINRQKSHPFQAKYSSSKNHVFLHAETQAIVHALRFLSMDDLLKTDLYICRMKNVNGKFVYGLAKPCLGCFRAIVDFGIPNVYYTTDIGTIEEL